jgi:hypothetical protein
VRFAHWSVEEGEVATKVPCSNPRGVVGDCVEGADDTGLRGDPAI